MFLVKAKVDGQSMVIPCQGMGPDPRCVGMTRLDGIDLMINNFRATFLTVHPRDIEFVAEGIVLQSPVQADAPAGDNGIDTKTKVVLKEEPLPKG